jgi:hypothetical protein
MTILIVASVLIGIAVGLRFRVLFIVPLILAAIIVVVAIETAGHESLWTIVAATIVCVVSLQVGYLGGSFIRTARERG